MERSIQRHDVIEDTRQIQSRFAEDFLQDLSSQEAEYFDNLGADVFTESKGELLSLAQLESHERKREAEAAQTPPSIPATPQIVTNIILSISEILALAHDEAKELTSSPYKIG